MMNDISKANNITRQSFDRGNIALLQTSGLSFISVQLPAGLQSSKQLSALHENVHPPAGHSMWQVSTPCGHTMLHEPPVHDC